MDTFYGEASGYGRDTEHTGMYVLVLAKGGHITNVHPRDIDAAIVNGLPYLGALKG